MFDLNFLKNAIGEIGHELKKMFSFEQIISRLPPIREDEPASLRQEIADEIIDHLQCGLRRELLMNGGDESAARQNVLEKFGDPGQVARQLWFQAMWSKIMSQRLVLLISSTSMIATVVLVAMMFWTIQRQSQNVAALQSQNNLLLERLTQTLSKSDASEPQRGIDWNSLKVKVTLDSEDGPAAEGYAINVSRVPQIGESTHSYHVNTELGKDGIEDCGFVSSGQYLLRVKTPWGEFNDRKITIFPGHDHVEHVVAPSRTAESTKIRMKFAGLESLEAESNDVIVLSVVPSAERSFAGKSWGLEYWNPEQELPSFAYVPQQGFFMTRGKQMLQGGYPLNVKNSSWNPCALPVEFDLLVRDYVIQISKVRLRAIYDTKLQDRPPWERRVIVDLDQNGKPIVPLNPSHIYQIENKFLARIGMTNKWEVSIPDVVIKSFQDGTVLPSTARKVGVINHGVQTPMTGGGFF